MYKIRKQPLQTFQKSRVVTNINKIIAGQNIQKN